MPLNATPDPSSSAEATWRIQPQGDRCLIVSFGDRIDAAVGRTCLAAARKLRDAGLPGVTDVVPSFVAVAVHYRPDGLGHGPTYADLAERIEALLADGIAADLDVAPSTVVTLRKRAYLKLSDAGLPSDRLRLARWLA